MSNLTSDLRFATRQLTRRPGMTLTALLTLALGTGSATAIFSVVDGVLLRPLPFTDAGRLIAICETHPSIAGYCSASPPDIEDWSRQSRTLASLGLGRTQSFHLRFAGGSEGVSGGLATPGFFRTLDVRPALGRVFSAADLNESGRHVAVLSDEVWRTEFGADPGILGRPIVLDGESYAVIGVLKPRLDVPGLESVRIWVPLPFDPRDEENRKWRGFLAFGRLAPGATVAAAQAELGMMQRQLGERFPESNRGWGARAEPLLDHVVGRVRPTLLVFLGAVGLLLLVACANVANLLVARGAAREREFALRSALGALPTRLFRLVAMESGLLALLGGAAGILFAAWAAEALLALMPSGLPRIDQVNLDARVIAFALALTVVTGLITGLVPALRIARLDLSAVIKAGHQPQTWRRTFGVRGGLVIAEVAMAFMLAIGAGLLTRSFASLLRWDPGFDQRGVLTFWTYASSGTYPDPDRVTGLFERIESDLRSIPSVQSVGMTSAGPLFGGGDGASEFTIAGDPSPGIASWYDMSPGYFRTLGVKLRSGRMFDVADRPGSRPVAIVNEAFARHWFAGRDPVGAQVVKKGRNGSFEIVGVVADIPSFTPGAVTPAEIYWPYAQSPRWASFFVIRTSDDPTAIARQVNARLHAIDPDLTAGRVATMQDLVGAQLRRPRFNMLLIGVFAAMALILTTVGVYGVMAASVAGRTRELGVRVALGAQGNRVIGMVMKEGMLLAGIGMGLGAVLALALSRFVSALLFGVRAADPLTFGGIAVLLAIVTGIACYVPARRAARVDPMDALRADG